MRGARSFGSRGPVGPRVRAFGSASLATLGFVALSGCANGCTHAPQEASVTAASTPPVTTVAAPAPAKKAAPLVAGLPEAVRRRDFTRALTLWNEQPEAERKEPEMRYLRAVIAVELADPETALRELDQLEVTYPPLRAEVDQLRATAARASGDVTVLAHFFATSRSSSDHVALGEAYLRAGDANAARASAERALVLAQQASSAEKTNRLAEAHELLGRLHKAAARPREALVDYVWLATVAPTHARAAGADDTALELGRALTFAERLTRAQAFSERGRVAETEREVELLRKLATGTQTASFPALLAWAVYYSRTDYARAATLFAEAAKSFGDKTNEHLYYEAKSLSRNQRDDEALVKYRALSRLGGPFAEHALFQVARLTFLAGDWPAAVKAYEIYAASYKKGRQHEAELNAELPLARLAAGQFERAERELGALVDRQKEPLERARLVELWGSAAEGAGKRVVALTRYRAVIDDRPLSLPALLAQSRIIGLGEPPPPVILPGTDVVPTAPLSLELPDKTRRLDRVGLDELAEASLQAEEGRLRASFGARADEGLCELYGQLASARRRYQIAQTATSWSALRVAPTARTRWQSSCIYPAPYSTLVKEATARFQLAPAFVYGVMRQESAFRPSVISPANAVGLMQIIPPTATRIAAELDVGFEPSRLAAPATNVQFGVFYLRKLLDTFAGRLELAAAAYNAGPSAVSRWLSSGEKLPLDLFLARIPYEETRNYVVRVIGNTARYAYLEGGESAIPPIELTLPTGIQVPADAY